MNKSFLIGAVAVLTLSAALWGSNITVKSPKVGDEWCIGNPYTITWTKSGTMPDTVAIRLRRAGASESELAVANLTNSMPNAGSFAWTVPASVPAGDYFMRVRTKNPSVIGDSANFKIKACAAGGSTVVLNPKQTLVPGQVFSLQQKMIIHSPKGGSVWKPLANYAITWEAFKNKYPASAYAFNVKLASVDNPAFFPLTLKNNHWSVAKSTANSNIYTFDWKFLGSMNIPSGKYKVTIQSVSIPDFKGETGIITVQNTISSNTAFLGEDEPDLIIEEVYYDLSKKSMWARIKNQGFSSYTGPLTINYQFKLGSVTYNTPSCQSSMNGEAKFPNITLNKYQANGYFICKWPCFDKRPADFFPITGPVKYQVFISATGKKTTAKSGVICKSKVPDVIVDNHFLLRGKGDPAYLLAFQQASLSPGSFNWISDTTFEAKVEVNIRNWGCQGKQFDIKLHMDGNYLNGRKEVTLGSISLASGQQTTFVSGPVKFSIPKDKQYHKMLLVAYQGELNGEGYPNAYKNNFILTHVRLEEKSNTIRGVVDW